MPHPSIKLQENVPLAPYTTLDIGGPARFFCEAKTEGEVGEAAKLARERGVPLFVLGGGSNLLVSDAGFDGLVMRVGVVGSKRESREGESSISSDQGKTFLRGWVKSKKRAETTKTARKARKTKTIGKSLVMSAR